MMPLRMEISSFGDVSMKNVTLDDEEQKAPIHNTSDLENWGQNDHDTSSGQETHPMEFEPKINQELLATTKEGIKVQLGMDGKPI